MIQVLVLSGKIAAGKDAAADALAERLRATHRVIDLAFGDALKQQYADARELPEGSVKRLKTEREFKASHRPGLIAFGTEQRAKDPDVFIKATLAHVQPPQKGVDVVYVIKDCRFRNELALTVSHCQKHQIRVRTVRLWAPEAIRKERGWKPSDADSDASECELDDAEFDLVYCNRGTPEELGRVVASMVAEKAEA